MGAKDQTKGFAVYGNGLPQVDSGLVRRWLSSWRRGGEQEMLRAKTAAAHKIAHYVNAKTTKAEAVHIPRCAVPSL